LRNAKHFPRDEVNLCKRTDDILIPIIVRLAVSDD